MFGMGEDPNPSGNFIVSWVHFLTLHSLIQVENSTKVKRSCDFQAKADVFYLFFIFLKFLFYYTDVFVCLESVSKENKMLI